VSLWQPVGCELESHGTLCADMDGFKLLEHIGLELDLPVISECCSIAKGV